MKIYPGVFGTRIMLWRRYKRLGVCGGEHPHTVDLTMARGRRQDYQGSFRGTQFVAQ